MSLVTNCGFLCFVYGFYNKLKVPLNSRETFRAAYGDFGYIISSRMRCAGYFKGGN